MADLRLSLKRVLKKARLFEVQKLTRRVRMLEQKRGTEAQVEKNQRKAKRLLEEMEMVKELNLTELALTVIQAIAGGTFKVGDECCGTDVQERAKWRLLTSKPFQKGLDTIKKTPDFAHSLDTSSEELLVKRESEAESEESANQSSGTDGSAESNLGKVEDLEDTEVITCGSTSSPRALAHDEDSLGPRKRQKPKVKGKALEGVMKWHKGTDVSTSTGGSNPAYFDTDQTTAVLGVGSLFVDSLAASTKYVSRGKKRSGYKERKKPKNRMGQRSRQRLWESAYGTEAKHFQKQKKLKSTSVDHHTRRGATTHHQPDGSSHSTPPDGQRELHPSWAAARRRKAKETMIKGFQGQRVTFSDSD